MHVHHHGDSTNPPWSALLWLLPAVVLAVAAVVFPIVAEPGHPGDRGQTADAAKTDLLATGSSKAGEMSLATIAERSSPQTVLVAPHEDGARIEEPPVVLETQAQADFDLVGASIGAYDR